jgi:hypothetical protein
VHVCVYMYTRVCLCRCGTRLVYYVFVRGRMYICAFACVMRMRDECVCICAQHVRVWAYMYELSDIDAICMCVHACTSRLPERERCVFIYVTCYNCVSLYCVRKYCCVCV